MLRSPVLPPCLLAGAVRSIHAIALAAAWACAVPAFAQESIGEGSPSTSSWSLGMGAISRQQPYAGIDRKNMALPVLRFENRYVLIAGPQIGLKLPSLPSLPSLRFGAAQSMDFSILGAYDGSGYEAKDAAVLAGMIERKGGFWAGIDMTWKNDLVDVKAAWLADASAHSKGQRFSLGLERTWRFGQHLMLTPRVEANWHDKKYVDYYFGVRGSEARLGRPAYAGTAGTSAEVGLRGVYLFDPRHSVFVDVSVSSLAKGVKDSPLVDRSTENRVILGYTYRFR